MGNVDVDGLEGAGAVGGLTGASSKIAMWGNLSEVVIKASKPVTTSVKIIPALSLAGKIELGASLVIHGAQIAGDVINKTGTTREVGNIAGYKLPRVTITATRSNMGFPATWDRITNNRILQLDPRVRLSAAKFINRTDKELNIKLRIAQGLRTIEKQNALYAIGRTKPGRIVTNARGGQSYHNFGLAIDVYQMENGKIEFNSPIPNPVVNIAKQEGFEWGGDWFTFKDYPHFQMTFGQNLRQLRLHYGIMLK